MRTPILFAAVLAALVWMTPAAAPPSPGSAGLSRAQTERVAVELKQGMTLEEVQGLLGKPRRTALKHGGTLQWTYSWVDNSSPRLSLQVVFAAKAPEQWFVDSWQWDDY